MKASDLELSMHSLIQDKDDLALAKLYDLYGESVVLSLKKWFPNIARKDESLILEAVNEAFLGYYNNGQTFNPHKSTLLRFLEIAADRDLKNILQREKKHFQKQNIPEDVELEEHFWNSVQRNNQSTDETMIHRESLESVDRELANYFECEKDILLAKMILSGERETDPFADVLNIRTLLIDEQRKEVKRNKDRIKKVLERNQIEEKLKRLLQ